MSANYVMQIVEPQAYVNPDNHKKDDNSYTFDYDVILTAPMPAANGFKGIQSVNVDGGRNADGDFQGAVVGQPKRKIDNFSWENRPVEVLRPLLKHFDNPDNFEFFARYFDWIQGEYQIRQFYRGDINVEPHIFTSREVTVDETTTTVYDFDKFKLVRMNIIEV